MWRARPPKKSSPQAARLVPPTGRNRGRPLRPRPGRMRPRQLDQKRRKPSLRILSRRRRKPFLRQRPAARSPKEAPPRPPLPLLQRRVPAARRRRRRRQRPPPHPLVPAPRDPPPLGRRVRPVPPGLRQPSRPPLPTRNPLDLRRPLLPAGVDRADRCRLRGRARRHRRCDLAGERHCWPGWPAV